MKLIGTKSLIGKNNCTSTELDALLNSRFEPAPIGKVEITFEDLPDGSICRVDVKSNSEIVHLDGKDVYIRDGNTTRKLEGPTLTRWISERTAR